MNNSVLPNDSEEFFFEFERKFFVQELPAEVAEHGSLQIILQAYVFAQGGYAIRVRLSVRDVVPEFPPFAENIDFVGAYERKVLAEIIANPQANLTATMAMKSPAINGERYEAEYEVDTDVAIQILQRAERLVLKKRYSAWFGQDGWEFDVFAGQNRGLIIAECERLTPVVDLEIPRFCVTEVTADPRFTNDSLSKTPWAQWDVLYRKELAERGPYFLNLRK